MPRLNLTQKAVAKLAAPHLDGKQTVYWDDELRGFGVLCSVKTNQKMFIVQRDLPDGKTRRVNIGPVSGMALPVARQRAEDTLDDLRRGLAAAVVRRAAAHADGQLRAVAGILSCGLRAAECHRQRLCAAHVAVGCSAAWVRIPYADRQKIGGAQSCFNEQGQPPS
jgi:hypothetical protein